MARVGRPENGWKAARCGKLRGVAIALLVTGSAWAAPREISRSELRAQVSSAGQIVAACAAQATACGRRNVPEAEQVAAEGSFPGFGLRWDWLSDALDQSAKASEAERLGTMQAARCRLDELAHQLARPGTQGTEEASFPAARAAAAQVLARSEFRADAGPTWLDRQVARVQDWLLHLLLGAGRVGEHNPWIAPLLEWLCFLLAAAGLLLFVRRSARRHALRLALGEAVSLTSRTDLSTADWTAAAAQAEAAGHWREAIHCLYWGAIAALETRRAWRPNPTRTPREYVRLLRSGSPAHEALDTLTRLFERTWYGSDAPSAAQVQAARRKVAALAKVELNRNAPASGQETSPASMSPADMGGAPA